MKGNKQICFLLMVFVVMFYGAKLNSQCSGTWTSDGTDCQTLTITSNEIIEICLTANNIPSGGGSSCNPGGACNPPFMGGGWAPRIFLEFANGNWTFTANSDVGECIYFQGPMTITMICLGGDTQTSFSWTTTDACGMDNCNGSPPFCDPPCDECSDPCPACGFNLPPTVQDVVDSCPDFPLYPSACNGEEVTRCASFTAAVASVDFSVIINSNCGSGNVTNFSWELFEASNCGTVLQSGDLTDLTFDNLTPGTQYVYCYTFNVPSGCCHTTHWPYFVGAIPIGEAICTIDAEISCNGANDGAVSAAPGGGTAPFIYNWSGPGGPYTGSSLTGLGPGTYTVTITDFNFTDATCFVTLVEPTAIVVNGVVTDANCPLLDDGAINISPTGGTPPYVNFNWDHLGPPSDSEDVGSLTPGTYTVTVTDDNGCTGENSFNVGGGPCCISEAGTINVIKGN